MRVNCFLIQSDEVILKLEENQQAFTMSIIVYPIQKWKNLNLTELQILTCISEELCHHYWNIEDEVLEVIRGIMPKANIQMADLYNTTWIEEQSKD